MPVTLNGNAANSLTNEILQINKWYNSSLPQTSTGGQYMTIEDFYNNFIEQRLPDTQTVKDWINLLLDYVNDKDSVFSIRIFANRLSINSKDQDSKDEAICRNHYNGFGKPQKKNSKTYYVNPYTLRRGFLTEFTTGEEFSYFFNDNFFAHYFLKMAYDGFVPNKTELKDALKNRTFSARFHKADSEEIAKAAYDIRGKLMKSPNINHYVAHVIDTGKDYFTVNGNKGLGLADICATFFPRGAYNDWVKQGLSLTNPNLAANIPGINYVRRMDYIGGLDYLKAHFLRFVCPVNYFLTPLCNTQQQGNNSKVVYKKQNSVNIGELKDLQEYIIGMFNQKYGKDYVNYLKAIMWQATPSLVSNELTRINNNLTTLGKTIIDLQIVPNSNIAKQNINVETHSKPQNNRQKISFDASLVNKSAADREAYLLKGVSPNYLDKSGLKKIIEINGIVNSLFSGKSLFDLTNAQEIIAVWKEVKKQSWNEKTSRGIPAAIVSNYCMAVTGQAPRK